VFVELMPIAQRTDQFRLALARSSRSVGCTASSGGDEVPNTCGRAQDRAQPRWPLTPFPKIP
jgi:hypothetical protein